MKRFLSLYENCNRHLLLVILLGFSPSVLSGSWDKLPSDKAAHFGLSSVAVEGAMKSCQAWQATAEISPACRGWSSVLVFTAGILKEVSDQENGGTFDPQDLVADALGILTGNILQLTF